MAWCRRMQNPKELEDSDSDIENEIQTTLQEDDVEMQDAKQTISNKTKRLKGNASYLALKGPKYPSIGTPQKVKRRNGNEETPKMKKKYKLSLTKSDHEVKTYYCKPQLSQSKLLIERKPMTETSLQNKIVKTKILCGIDQAASVSHSEHKIIEAPLDIANNSLIVNTSAENSILDSQDDFFFCSQTIRKLDQIVSQETKHNKVKSAEKTHKETNIFEMDTLSLLNSNIKSVIDETPNLKINKPTSINNFENNKILDSQCNFLFPSQTIKNLDHIQEIEHKKISHISQKNDINSVESIQNTNNNYMHSSLDKLKQLNFQNNETLGSMWLDQSLTSSQYHKEIDLLFEKVETTICQFGPEAEQPINDYSVADSAFTSANWNDESFVANAIINMTVQEDGNKSFGTVIKRALLENVKKAAAPSVIANKTFVEIEPTFKQIGPFYGLPVKVKDLLQHYRGIEKLYDWQDECLQLPAIENRTNLIYALPTSGGKTLVAEILMLREVLCRRRNAIFILPFVAIVQEKVWSLSPFAVALDFLVEEYASSKGSYPPRKRRRKNSIYISTIEKALGLINSLYENGRINELGVVIVDELHLIGEQGRGATLEALLTKLMHINEDIHIVGMSATIGNVSEICTFLNAEVYTRNFRPVELTEYVKCGNKIAKINWNIKDEDEVLTYSRTVSYNYSDALKQIDPDMLGGLVMEVVPKDSCLIFCPSKKSCENVAYLLCRVIFASLKNYKKDEKEQLKNALNEESGALCDILNVSLPFGVAYHHSGLTNEERRLIEEGFRTGIISVICCTSTLAAGVNLPAKRVILRKPYIGRDFISLSRYKQMVGRAGRAGMGEAGESILICEQSDLPKIKALLMSPMDEALSNLHDSGSRGLRHLLLSCISLGMATTRTQLHEVTKKTLMAVQQQKLEVDVKKLTDKALTELFKLGALSTSLNSNQESVSHLSNLSVCIDSTQCVTAEETVNTAKKDAKKRIFVSSNTKLQISKLGSAAIKGSLELSKAHVLYEDLLQAQANLVLLNDLHLLYLVIPYDFIDLVKPPLANYYNIFIKLKPKELHTAKILGFDESCAVKMLSNRLLKTVPEKTVNKFYLTLALYDLWNGMQVFEVADKFQVDRGLVQNLMTASATFASNIVSFCDELEEFWAFVHLLKGMSQRLSHCCIREIMPLMELPSVKQNRAKQLYSAGYTNLQKIAKANPHDLVQNIEFMTHRVAGQLIAAAKMLLLEKVENLREEAQDVLEGVEQVDPANQNLF